VAQLVEVYSERHPDETFADTQLSSHPKMGKHFQRQRISFYNAEALRLYARDSVPDGTFEALLDDIHAGVVEVAESDHASGTGTAGRSVTSTAACTSGSPSSARCSVASWAAPCTSTACSVTCLRPSQSLGPERAHPPST
jgi:hypothetical protein